jgi:hypothetical protein
MKGRLKDPVRNENKFIELLWRTSTTIDFFVYFLGWLEFVGHSFAYIVHFVFLSLVSNPESCRSKQARCQLSHPSP